MGTEIQQMETVAMTTPINTVTS